MIEKGGKDQERFRRGVDARTMRMRAMREGLPIKGLEHFHLIKTLQDASYEKVAASDYYYFTDHQSPSIPEEVLELDPERMKESGMSSEGMSWTQVPFLYHPFLYSNLQGLAEKTMNNCSELKEDYIHKGDGSYVPPDELAETAAPLLNRAYYLVHNITELHAAKPSVAFKADLRGNQQLALQQSLEKIGTEKSEAFSETMRRFVPRWMHHGISYPEADVPHDQDARIRTLWSGYTTHDAKYLIRSDDLAENKAPLHKALQASQVVEREGNADVGYALRTHAILNTLKSEDTASKQNPAYELEIFRWILGSSMAGEFGKVPTLAHFDYESAFTETMRQTFIRLQDELTSNQEGKAIAFLNGLYPHYKEDMTGLWVRSLVRSAQKSSDIDIYSIVTNLQKTSYPWQENLTEVLHDVPVRNVLSANEVEDIATVLQGTQAPLDSQKLINDIATLTDGEDMYSLHEKSASNITVTIDLDTAAEDIAASVIVTGNGKARIVPFHVSFAGDKESFSVDSIGDTPIVDEAMETYRGIITDVIARRAQTIREKAARKRGEPKLTGASQPDFTITTMTRAERIARYKDQKEKKKRRTSQKGKEVAVFPEVIRDTNIEQHLHLNGMDSKTIQDFLTGGRIKSVTAQTITDKLEHIVEATRINKKMLGKRIDTTAYDVGDTSSINLRQINFVFDGGRTPIRVYVQDMGKGEFMLRGILHKKGETQQTRYIKGLVQDLVTEQVDTQVDETPK